MVILAVMNFAKAVLLQVSFHQVRIVCTLCRHSRQMHHGLCETFFLSSLMVSLADGC